MTFNAETLENLSRQLLERLTTSTHWERNVDSAVPANGMEATFA